MAERCEPPRMASVSDHHVPAMQLRLRDDAHKFICLRMLKTIRKPGVSCDVRAMRTGYIQWSCSNADATSQIGLCALHLADSLHARY